jgi:hypothetical protein
MPQDFGLELSVRPIRKKHDALHPSGSRLLSLPSTRNRPRKQTIEFSDLTGFAWNSEAMNSASGLLC